MVLEQFNRAKTKSLVFVYATLLRGNSNHAHYLEESRYLGEAVLQGYSLYNLGYYPGVKPCETDKVKGELYQVDKETLLRLNHLEGEGHLYALKQESVLIGRQRRKRCGSLCVSS
ncbi:MAG: gamma-glutamylcyclotransferase family protein [Desulfitobacterium sp.]